MYEKKNNIKLPHDHGHENEEQIMEHLPGEQEIAGVSEAMKQLGDPSRLRIFWLLCHCEECVVNIAAIVGMTSPAVSHHLRLLKGSGLIVSRREGKEMYYRTADTELAQALHLIIEKIGKIACPQVSGNEQAPAVQPDRASQAVHASHSVPTSYSAQPHRGEKPSSKTWDNGQEEIIRQIHDLMTENLRTRYTIDELSRKYLINTSALKSVFKSVYGMPIASYMKQYRINRAAYLLRETTDSISAVAASVGYESQSKFTAAFKDIMKMLPTDYRKQHG